MSSGPIAQWRAGSTLPRVSTPNNARLCLRKLGTLTAECGRKKVTFAERDQEVTCADCLAAARADQN